MNKYYRLCRYVTRGHKQQYTCIMDYLFKVIALWKKVLYQYL